MHLPLYTRYPGDMCGRNSLFHPQPEIEHRFDAEFADDVAYEPRYNIAPRDDLHVVTNDDPDAIDALHWGFLPRWVDDSEESPRPINARAETAAEKPYFRDAFRERRCLVPSSGFYEWKGDRGGKQPYRIHPADDGLMAFAGLWDRWEGENGDSIASVTILTCDAAPAIDDIHDRMPVILPLESEDDWLTAEPDDAKELLRLREGDLDVYPVSTTVNDPANDAPEIIEESDQSGLGAFS